MGPRARIAGVGMTPFVKPGQGMYRDLGATAVRDALADAGLDYADVQQAFVGYVYGDSTSGQSALYEVGCTGIPIVNVNNNCSTGSTALYLAHQAVASGAADCVLALGFEQMTPGALQENYLDRPSPLSRFTDIADREYDTGNAPMALKLFGGAGAEYQQRYGTSDEIFARISVKARRHARHNERAIFRNEVTVEEVLASPRMLGPLTRLQCCPPTCGGGAAIIVSEAFARRKGLKADIAITGQAMRTDFPSTFNESSLIKVVGADLSAAAARTAYEEAGMGPGDVDVVELHDCFTANEILSYEALGFAPEGGAERFILDNDNTYGGKVVVNPSGGLLSKGHPLGATGLAQCAELVWQLRGQAGVRQVEGARVALQHNIGLGGACVVTIYERA
ncbi:lipid-transfer protein [Sphingobium estronivorans]|uniref:lipid-transfer protein n=1 Tax=Sphingobium estronivorans TaxID=1577690 RepID=UPI00123B83DE|nr:lipid-transfer protein [Sphingobium estronivorans]